MRIETVAAPPRNTCDENDSIRIPFVSVAFVVGGSLGPALIGVRLGRGVLVAALVGVDAKAVTVAKTASEVLFVEGVTCVEALLAAAVAIKLGVTVGGLFNAALVAALVDVSMGDVFDCKGGITRLPQAVELSITPITKILRDKNPHEKNRII